MAEVRFGPGVVDADGAILGRTASKLAKRLLMGEDIVVVNAEKAVLTGTPRMIKKKYLERRKRGSPSKGPFYPRYPDTIFKRTVRGMLPYKKQKGRKALERLKVHMGVPDKFKDKAEKIGKRKETLRCKYTTLGDVCVFLGAKKERWE